MVHVSMGEKNQIDRRQFLHEQSRLPLPSEYNETLGKYGVDQDLAAIYLKQERGVTYEGHAELIVVDQLDRARASGYRPLVTFPR